MPPLTALLRLMRPHQWVKNGFVFVGLIFGHAWRDPTLLVAALLGFAAFCLLSSGVYILNDWVDRESDRHHPEKRHRPLASGAVPVPFGLGLAAVCLAGGLAVAWTASRAPWLFVAYLALQVAYNAGAKHIVVLDVFIIAAGFMLRILAGTIGIGIPPTHWLLLCGLMLTLFLGFAKRRAELHALADDSAVHRRVLEHYSKGLLDQFIVIAATGTVVSYALYTVSPETMALHGTRWLIASVPFVLYGLLRYLYLLHRHGGGGDPAREVMTDPHLLSALAGWAILVVALLSS
ncbi:MAG TPA: decaprenyl-phosphate phosphoribosyltransferase [Rhodocyclaceae bacterium]